MVKELLRPASKMALERLASSLKSIIKKYIRGHLAFLAHSRLTCACASSRYAAAVTPRLRNTARSKSRVPILRLGPPKDKLSSTTICLCNFGYFHNFHLSDAAKIDFKKIRSKITGSLTLQVRTF